ALQWLNPRGFTIFLNGQQVLRDKRYKLIHYSTDELSIQLSRVTVHDEGSYKCFYYGRPFQSKAQPVEVLAAPSNPVLEVSQDTERGITLSCYTQGCKPQPRVTWLLDNGMELPGEWGTRHKLGADGKKWSTTSTLTVLSHGPNATASCIIHHPALRDERLMASFHFQNLPRTGTVSSFPLHCSEVVRDPNNQPALLQHQRVQQVPAQHQHQPSKTSHQISRLTQDPKSKGIMRKEKNLLLPILVATLIFVLLVIVLLFMMKLKKAHGVWKRENDVSEQTLESYKSRSNEDNPGHERNGQ
ncbi:CRTAM protein, partial [Mionectes macconnelli]|nr:CRTAM protein [Mionectes macconnelli]